MVRIMLKSSSGGENGSSRASSIFEIIQVIVQTWKATKQCKETQRSSNMHAKIKQRLHIIYEAHRGVFMSWLWIIPLGFKILPDCFGETKILWKVFVLLPMTVRLCNRHQSIEEALWGQCCLLVKSPNTQVQIPAPPLNLLVTLGNAITSHLILFLL